MMSHPTKKPAGLPEGTTFPLSAGPVEHRQGITKWSTALFSRKCIHEYFQTE
jgi:hypothetical protein